jgi:hypothetical protein
MIILLVICRAQGYTDGEREETEIEDHHSSEEQWSSVIWRAGSIVRQQVTVSQ